MSKFVYFITEPIVRYFEIEMEADNEDDAQEIAWEIFDVKDCEQVDSKGLGEPTMELVETNSDTD